MSTSDYTPTADMVARKIMSRTKDKFGKQLGTFTTDTIPTEDQVMDLSNDFMTELADVIGDDIPQAFWDDAANIAAIGIAMWIELNYYSDQVNTGRSIYPQLEELYKTKLDQLVTSIANVGETPGVNVPGREPFWKFPVAGNLDGSTW